MRLDTKLYNKDQLKVDILEFINSHNYWSSNKPAVVDKQLVVRCLNAKYIQLFSYTDDVLRVNGERFLTKLVLENWLISLSYRINIDRSVWSLFSLVSSPISFTIGESNLEDYHNTVTKYFNRDILDTLNNKDKVIKYLTEVVEPLGIDIQVYLDTINRLQAPPYEFH